MASVILSDNGVGSGSAGLKTTADSSGQLQLQTTTSGGTATTAVTIDNAQNMGLGVTPSASTLRMLQGPVDFVISSANSGLYLANNAYYNSGWKYSGSNTASRYAQDSGVHKWEIAASGTAGNAITFTQAMTLDANGNWSLGTTSAFSTAANRTVASINGTTDALFNIGVGGTQTAFFYSASTQANFGTKTNIPLTFHTNDTERGRWNAGAPILCLSGGNTSATGTGIAFPATQSASSDANTLDDYEEGTWTANSPSSGYTISETIGFYTKVGRLVTVQFSVTFSAVPANNSSVTMNGLPFAAANIGTGTSQSGVVRENSTSGAIYVTDVQASTPTIFEINSMDGVGAGNTRTIRTGERYCGTLTYIV